MITPQIQTQARINPSRLIQIKRNKIGGLTMDAIEKYNKIFDAHIKKVEDTIKCEKCGKTDLISFPNNERNPYLIEFYCMNHEPSLGINEYKWIRRLNHEKT